MKLFWEMILWMKLFFINSENTKPIKLLMLPEMISNNLTKMMI